MVSFAVNLFGVRPNNKLKAESEGQSLYSNINPEFKVDLGQKNKIGNPTVVFTAERDLSKESLNSDQKAGIQFEFSNIVKSDGSKNNIENDNEPLINKANDSQTLLYQDVIEHVDYSYEILSGRGIKESIILNEYVDTEKFNFTYKLNNVYPVFESGHWAFYDENTEEKMFYMDKPYMVDANGSRSDSVEILLEGDEFAISPDLDWLKSEDRVYPVVIDPTILISVINVYSHPYTGDTWSVDFKTEGVGDLVITPQGQASVEDLDFESLLCDEPAIDVEVDGDGTVSVKNWSCDTSAQINYFVNNAGDHELLFEFRGQIDHAYNSAPFDTSTSDLSTANSFQRKTWHDGTRYWASHFSLADSRIEFWYSTDGSSWTENTSARISDIGVDYDYSIDADSSYAFISYTSEFELNARSASSYPSTSFSWGTNTTIDEGLSQGSEQASTQTGFEYNQEVISSASIDANKTVILFQEAVTTGRVHAMIASNSGNTITYGSRYKADDQYGYSVDVTKIDTNKFLAVIGGSAETIAIVGTVSGSVITYGSAVTLSASRRYQVETICLTSTTCVIANQSTSWVATISGSSISLGSETTYHSGGEWPTLTKLDSTKFVIAYCRAGLSIDYLSANVGTVSGSSISYGSQATSGSAFGAVAYLSSATLSESKFVVASLVYPSSWSSISVVGTISGTTISFGSQYGVSGYCKPTGMVELTSNAFVVSYADFVSSSVDYGKFRIGTVSGSTISLGSEYTFNSADTLFPVVTSQNSTDFVVSYVDSGNSSKISSIRASVYDYMYPTIIRDTNSKPWVSFTEKQDSNYLFRTVLSTTANSIAAWETISTQDTSTNANKFGAMAKRSSGNAYAVWIDGTAIEGSLWSGSSWSSPGSIGTGVSGLSNSLSLVSDSSGNVHLGFIQSDGNLVYRYYNGSWQTAVTLDSNSANKYPTLTVANDLIYAFWQRSNHIYYKKGSSAYGSGDWSSATDWQTTGTNTNLTSGYSNFSTGTVFVEWTSGSSSPYSSVWESIALNEAPVNTSLTLTNPHTGNLLLANDSTEYIFRAVVDDSDGYEDLGTVKLRLATSADNSAPYEALEYTWTESTDTFSESADTGGVAAITSTGTESTCSSNQCTLDFKLKFNSNFATEETNYNAQLYTSDDSTDTDEDTYSSFYQVVSVYTIQNATNVNATLSSDWSTSVETTAQYGEVEVGVMSTGDLPVAKFTVDFDEDHDWSNLSADSSATDKRAYMHYTSGFDSIPGNVDSDYVLYVPKGSDDAMIGICPGVTSLSGVDKTCDNLYVLKSADANVSESEIAGDDYWAISGLTSTGGFSFSAYGEGLELRNVEVVRIGEARYLVAATTGGVTVTNEETWVSYDSDYNELVYKAVASENGDMYFITGGNNLQVVYDITDLTDDFSTDITYSATSTPAVTASDVDLNNIYVQTGTSWIDGYSNVIYLASDEGVVVINEKQGDETNGSVKYFTKDYVTEDLTGDVRGMWGFATDNADTALAVGDSLSSSDQIDGYSALDSDLEVYGTPDVVDGVRGTALEFNGSTDYLVQELYDSEQGTVSGTLTDGSAQLTDSSQDFDSWDTEGGSGSAVYLVEVTDNSGDAIWGYLYDESTDDGGSDTSVDIENSLDGTGSQNWSGDTSTFSFGDTPIVYEIKDTKFQLTGDFSLGAWVKYDSKDNYMRILDKYPRDNSTGYLLGLDGSTDQKFGLYVRIPSDIQKGIPSKTVPEIGTWYFVVAVYDSSAGTIYIYVNGELENLNNEVGSEILAGGTSFAVGCKEANGTKYMDGVIDEPFVFAEALSSEQIKHLYEIGNRSLQNHESSNLSGVSVDSDFQQLYGDTNISTSLTVDNTKGLMYVGTNDSSNSGGVSVINLSSDSLIDIYSNQSSKIDMSGAYWESTYNDIESIDVSSNLIGDESSNVLIASDEILWSGSSDVSLLNVVNDLSSSTLVKDLLVAKQINMKGDIKPDVAGVYDLGSSDLYWSGAYADTFYSTSATIGSFDIAEDFYAMDPNIQAGDVVAFADGRASAIDKTSVLYQRDVVGVISTQPGITLSYWRGDAEEIKNMRPVALAGRVPVKVTDENGVIEKGDFLVPASKPGYAMKACGVKYCEPAMVIGRALETFESDQLGDSEEVSTELVNSRIEVDEQLSNSQTEHPLEELGTLLLDPSGSITEQETVEDGIVAAVGAVEDVLTQVMDQSNTSVGEGRIMMFVDLMWYVPVGYEGVNDLDMTVDDRLEYLGQALDTVELNTTAWTLEGSVLSAQSDIVANAFYSDSVAFSIVTSEVIKVGGSNFVVDSQGNVDMAGDLKIAGVLSGKYGDLKVILGDDQGQTALNIENNEGDTVFSVDSQGQLHAYEIGIIDSEDKTLGRAKLLAGKDSLKILSSAINPDVKIFITPRMNDDSVEIPRLVVSNKQDGFFVVSLDEISTVDIDFDWWVVE